MIRGVNLRLATQELLLVAVPLLFEYAFVGTLWFLLWQSEIETRRETRARAAMTEATTITRLIYIGGAAMVSGVWE